MNCLRRPKFATWQSLRFVVYNRVERVSNFIFLRQFAFLDGDAYISVFKHPAIPRLVAEARDADARDAVERCFGERIHATMEHDSKRFVARCNDAIAIKRLFRSLAAERLTKQIGLRQPRSSMQIGERGIENVDVAGIFVLPNERHVAVMRDGG